MKKPINNISKETQDEKYVCVLCLNSFSTKYVSENGVQPTTAYFMSNWDYKGDCVRICYDCFTYG